MLAIWTS